MLSFHSNSSSLFPSESVFKWQTDFLSVAREEGCVNDLLAWAPWKKKGTLLSKCPHTSSGGDYDYRLINKCVSPAGVSAGVCLLFSAISVVPRTV